MIIIKVIIFTHSDIIVIIFTHRVRGVYAPPPCAQKKDLIKSSQNKFHSNIFYPLFRLSLARLSPSLLYCMIKISHGCIVLKAHRHTHHKLNLHPVEKKNPCKVFMRLFVFLLMIVSFAYFSQFHYMIIFLCVVNMLKDWSLE